jgi:hypothetical protein
MPGSLSNLVFPQLMASIHFQIEIYNSISFYASKIYLIFNLLAPRLGADIVKYESRSFKLMQISQVSNLTYVWRERQMELTLRRDHCDWNMPAGQVSDARRAGFRAHLEKRVTIHAPTYV